jgi:hypothetical protein
MTQIDLNAGLAVHCVRPGDPGRNPSGRQGSPLLRRRNIDIKKDLYAALGEPCDISGFEHMSKFEFGIEMIVTKFMAGDRWAVKFVTERLWGRVPIELGVTQRLPDLSRVPPDELLERVDRIREQLREKVMATPVTESTVIEASAVDTTQERK